MVCVPQRPAQLLSSLIVLWSPGGPGDQASALIEHSQLEAIGIGGTDRVAMNQIGWRTARLTNQAEPWQYSGKGNCGPGVVRQGGFEAVVQGARQRLQLSFYCCFLALQQQLAHAKASAVQKRAHH